MVYTGCISRREVPRMAIEDRTDVWRKRLSDFARSGLSVRKWCEKNGVSECQHTYWRRKLAVTGDTNTMGALSPPIADQVAAVPVNA